MVTDMYGALLQELGHALKINNLHPDRNNTCLITLTNGVSVYVELDKAKEYLLIGTEIGTVAPGRYRENVFREAMKANGLPYPRYGTFAFSKQANKLILFEKLHVIDLTGARVASILNPLAEKAKIWKEAITRGDVPTVSTVKTSQTGMFGLK